MRDGAGRAAVRPRGGGCDLAVVEGVMGLYDGAAGRGELASTAQVAKLLRAPVVLVVDASSQSRSVAALVHGFASFDPQVRLGGVILNKVGSDRHEMMLREALEEAGMPVLGVLRRAPQVAAPSRHLGLVPSPNAAPTPSPRSPPLRPRSAPAATWKPSCPWPARPRRWTAKPGPRSGPWIRVIRPRRRSRRGPGTEPRPTTGHRGRGRPGLHVLLRGARRTPHRRRRGRRHLRPAPDEALPDATTGLVIGGGFPEVYAPELSANAPLRRAVADFAAAGGPVAAECAGLLYLARSLDGKPMCGVLDADARMSERLTLGYREAVAVSDSALAATGTRLRGHEFHRTVIEPGAGAAPAWGFTHPERRVEGFVQGAVHASYLHTHWAAQPSVARRFARAAAARR
ncbi:AAA family ATPase [Streptomyces cirratus]